MGEYPKQPAPRERTGLVASGASSGAQVSLLSATRRGAICGAVRRVGIGAPCCRTPHRKNRKPYTVWYDVGTIKQLALDTGMTQQDLMVMAANDLFKRFDKPPIAI